MICQDDAIVLVLLCLAWIAISKYKASESPVKRLSLVAAGYLLCRIGCSIVNTAGSSVPRFMTGTVLIFLGSSTVGVWMLSGSAFLIVLAARSLLHRRASPPVYEVCVGYGLMVHWGFAAIVVASLLAACLFVAWQWFRTIGMPV